MKSKKQFHGEIHSTSRRILNRGGGGSMGFDVLDKETYINAATSKTLRKKRLRYWKDISGYAG